MLVWWQAERGQALLRPDATTLGALSLPAAALAAASVVVLARSRRAAPVSA